MKLILQVITSAERPKDEKKKEWERVEKMAKSYVKIRMDNDLLRLIEDNENKLDYLLVVVPEHYMKMTDFIDTYW